MFVPTNVYLLLSNPAGPTNGFECTLTPVGVPYFILSTNLGPNTLDVDGSANGFAVGAASNYPVVGGQIVLATLSVMLQGAGELAFYITDATAPSLAGELPVVTGDGVLRRCGVASGSVTAAGWWHEPGDLPGGRGSRQLRWREEPVPLGRVWIGDSGRQEARPGNRPGFRLRSGQERRPDVRICRPPPDTSRHALDRFGGRADIHAVTPGVALGPASSAEGCGNPARMQKLPLSHQLRLGMLRRCEFARAWPAACDGVGLDRHVTCSTGLRGGCGGAVPAGAL
jgi:hypothetical protein